MKIRKMINKRMVIISGVLLGALLLFTGCGQADITVRTYDKENEDSIKKANLELQNLKSKFLRNTKCLNIAEYEFKNMLTVSQVIINSALNRKESRGAHYRIDYPFTKDIAEHSCIMNKQGELSFVR